MHLKIRGIMYKGILLILFLVVHTSAFAGKVSEFFSDGAFGVQWGDTLEEVRKSHPEGSIAEYAGIKNYIIPHSKPILKITRDDTDITFTFNSLGKLHAIGVSFEGNEFGEVYTTLKTYFGDHEPHSNSMRLDWPEDEGIKMYLVSLPTGFSIKPMLTIENVSPAGDGSKEDLGLN